MSEPSDDIRTRRLRGEYMARINRVVDYIGAHLHEELDLATLAKVANFSPYHFHRLFSALTGETLAQFIARLRAERAASKIKQNPQQSLTEIALECGYSGSATFSRAFKVAFGMTPTEWRQSDSKLSKAARKYGETLSNAGKDKLTVEAQFDPRNTQLKWRVTMKIGSQITAAIEVRTIESMHIAYVRHVGPYAGNSQLFESLFGKLMMWAAPRGLMGPQAKLMSVYYDDPSVTDESKLRVDCAITIAPDTPIAGEVCKTTIPGGTYAIGHFEIEMNQYSEAWQAIMGGWLPESGFQPADGPCFELYLNDPKEHPENKCVVDIHVPVKPL